MLIGDPKGCESVQRVRASLRLQSLDDFVLEEETHHVSHVVRAHADRWVSKIGLPLEGRSLHGLAEHPDDCAPVPVADASIERPIDLWDEVAGLRPASLPVENVLSGSSQVSQPVEPAGVGLRV